LWGLGEEVIFVEKGEKENRRIGVMECELMEMKHGQ
jgi:hypothetical protein